MRRALAALTLTTFIVLAGCASLDDLVVADVPDSELASGWSLDDENTGKDTVEAGPLTVAAFSKQVYEHSSAPQGVMAIVTVTDVPLANVQGRIREEFQKTLDDRDVDRTERRSGEIDVDGYTAEYTLYDAQTQQGGTNVEGFVLEYTYGCSDSGTAVGFLGFAVTEVQTGFGGGTDESTWEDVAGPNWESEIGGMAKDVKCRA